MDARDPAFWRAGAISTTVVMFTILAFLTLDSYTAIWPGGSHVPPYTVINRHIDYQFNPAQNLFAIGCIILIYQIMTIGKAEAAQAALEPA